MSEALVEYQVLQQVVASVRCTCHGTVKMAEVVDGQLVVKDKRHGETHILVLDRIPPSRLSFP